MTDVVADAVDVAVVAAAALADISSVADQQHTALLQQLLLEWMQLRL